MNVMSFNSCGIGVNKCKAISRLCAKHSVSFLGIQETHVQNIDPFKIKSMWGNFKFQFASIPADGRSGGILSIWDPSSFKYVRSVHMEGMLIVEGEWILNRLKCYMVNIYAPQDDRKKEELWQIILTFRNENPGSYILFGDFNVVRRQEDR